MHKISVGIVVAVVIALLAGAVLYSSPASTENIKIGIITDLTGPAAYWGESTRIGAELALEDLRTRGYTVEYVYEDYKLDPAIAASAAQKITTIDRVDAAYIELNPGVVAAAPIIASARIPMIYDAAVVSPLLVSENFFKTYLDYEAGCEELAHKFKEEGVTRLGTLKLNLENGDLCLKGLQKVYPETIVEPYNVGETDFRTPLLKLQSSNVEALVNVGFPGDISNALQVIKSQNMQIRYATVDDSLTPEIKARFATQLQGGWTFGFKSEDESFTERIDERAGGTKLATYYGAALAYTHITQLVESLAECEKEVPCAVERIAASKPDTNSGFLRFENGVAQLEMSLKQY